MNRSPSAKDTVLGGTDMHRIHKCPCLVWIMKPVDGRHYRRILPPVDQDPVDAIDYLVPQLHVTEDSAGQVIPAMAREFGVDFIVMETVARTGIARLFIGDTAENILNQIDWSVLTIKPPGSESPVAA